MKKITRRGGHVGRCPDIKILVTRALRVMWDADRVKHHEEAPSVEGVAGGVWRCRLKMRGLHGLLRLERGSLSQNARVGARKGMDHAWTRPCHEL